MTCNCKICQTHQEFIKNLELLPVELKSYFMQLYDDYTHVQLDRDYLQAVVDGSWPTSKEVINSYRRKRRQKVQNANRQSPRPVSN